MPIAINSIVPVVIIMNSRLAKFVAVAAIFSFAIGALAETSSVSLNWDPNTETDIAGYKVYRGTSSGVYNQSKDVPQSHGVGVGPDRRSSVLLRRHSLQ